MIILSGLQSVRRACAKPQVVPKQQNPRQTNRQCPHTREVLFLMILDWIQILIFIAGMVATVSHYSTLTQTASENTSEL